MNDNFAKFHSLLDLHRNKRFQKEFVERYILNIPLFAFEVLGVELTYQQVDIAEHSGIHLPYNLAVPSGHGIGKDFFIGVITLHTILCYETSICRLQAPRLSQITKYSFKEIRHKLSSLTPRWAFLENYFVTTTTLIYIKGYKLQWYIEAMTAPKGEPTNLSGQHNNFYLLILNEASGIPKAHIEGSLGGLTEEFNKCIMFSQHTSLQGFFHSVVTEGLKSWKVMRMSSINSPKVSDNAIVKMREQYTDSEFRVRVEGLPPTEVAGTLINDELFNSMYESTSKLSIPKDAMIVISSDVGFTGERDNGAVALGFAWSEDGKVHCVLKELELCVGLMPTGQGRYSYKRMKEFLHTLDGCDDMDILAIIDANSGGREAYTTLKSLVDDDSELVDRCKVVKLTWGSPCIGINSKYYINQRAMGYVEYRNAISNSRFSLETNRHKTRLRREINSMTFTMSDTNRYRMVSKRELARNNIASPDIGDAIAQIFTQRYADIDVEGGIIEVTLDSNESVEAITDDVSLIW